MIRLSQKKMKSKRIRVMAGTQVFWVKNKKKIRFWEGICKNKLLAKNNNNAIKISKVEL